MTTDIDGQAEALAAYPTAVVSDALDELGVCGAVPHLAAVLRDQRPVAGTALTVRFEPRERDPAAHRFGGGVGRPLEQVLRAMRAGQVVVMDLQGSRTASAWGGLASRLAQRKGVRGTVLFGTCRDVDEIRDLAYPVWSVGTYPRRSRNSFTFGAIGDPVELAGVRVRTGDVILGDASGVVCVPQDMTQRVLALAAEISGTERALLEQIESDAVVDWDAV